MKLRNTKVVNKNGFTPSERKMLHLWWGERNRKFECGLRPYPNFQTGFTILEVMVALAIVGISIGIFFGLIGNSSKLRGKIDEHTKLLLLARTKTEEAFLGILGKKYEKLNEEKTFEGVTKDGVQWKVSQVDKYKEARKKITMEASNEDESDVEIRTGLFSMEREEAWFNDTTKEKAAFDFFWQQVSSLRVQKIPRKDDLLTAEENK